MKTIIASDLHGSFYYVNQLIARFYEEKADELILLGDILYHGPRNDLPKEYSPKKVIALLNPLKEKITCVQGNCDAEVDSMVLDFDLLTPYKQIRLDNLTVHLTHGHKNNPEKPLNANAGEVVLFGHSHIPYDQVIKGVRYINPGSVSIPKNNSAHSFIVYENGNFIFKSLND